MNLKLIYICTKYRGNMERVLKEGKREGLLGKNDEFTKVCKERNSRYGIIICLKYIIQDHKLLSEKAEGN